MKVLCVLAMRLDASYLVFEPIVRAAMKRQHSLRGRACEVYEEIVLSLMQVGELPP